MKQWFFKITEYADALLKELPSLDWPKKIKLAQENWIGKSVGAEITFSLDNADTELTVFSTRPDTLFGATFLVLAPEHPLSLELANSDTIETVQHYIDQSLKRSEIDRMAEGKEKTGVFTGSYAINPASGQKVPVWVADYVLWGYGTGAVMVCRVTMNATSHLPKNSAFLSSK
jgi:leucyl-tRNA synthetase